MVTHTCDRCGGEIDIKLDPGTEGSHDRINLGLDDGSQERFDLHHSCANEFRAEFRAWVARAKLNPPTA